MPYKEIMNGEQFIRKVRGLGRKNDIAVRVNQKRGKGSHKTIYYGSRFTIVQHGEIPTGTMKGMCKALGIRFGDL